ncbi:NAD(P)/FAD-dependent oxidoreductase [Nocardia asteroides]|uniref:NAD(P)/FAD-dependent oxidoreductase n=1 Tax=Nocardia asteroides TaxID=1824 RepID=UPI001E3C5D51|nr:FAD-dependent oxidoreductase [Nocardia asteroides]UGT57067.1 FAD-dependent oxidoreductase [Nocardia asteroides]
MIDNRPSGQTAAEHGRRRIAVIGSGVAGLTAAWVLARTCDVVLYEADTRLGGHAHTHEVNSRADGTGDRLGVDSGFIVHNDRTYPTLLRLFDELGVRTQDSDMSMSIRCDGCGLEYAGAKGLRGLLPRPGTALNGRYLRMLAEIGRFHRLARAELDCDGDDARTLGEFVRAGAFSAYFTAHFLVPLVAAVWSCPPDLALRYPARYLFTFLDHHGMLTVFGSPTWRTVVGGSATYVRAVAAGVQEVRAGTPVRTVHRGGSSVTVRDDADRVDEFDAAVLATHPGQALRLLDTPTWTESSILAALTYSTNHTVLHTDESVLPRRAAARASWNYRLPHCDSTPDRVLVSYDLSRLHRLPATADRRFLVTLGDGDRVAPDAVLATMTYEHPQYTPGSMTARRRLPEIGDRVVAFAGAYHGWGFHEDGALSGLRAAERVGGHWPARPAPAPVGVEVAR